MTRIAAIDCGTNTIKLLIAEIRETEPLRVLAREARMVRLGQDLDRTGRIAPEALARAFTALEEYAALILQQRVARIRFCATSATRDADNAAEFTAGVQARLGVRPEVLSGDEEARLAFAGALAGLRAPAPEPLMIVDVGGGSTELILGTTADGPRVVHSMDIGSVRLHERHLRDDPATAAQVAACVADIDAQLDACPVDPAAAGTVIGIAGTVTTVAAGVLGLASYDREAIDGSVLPSERVLALIDDLVAMPSASRRELGYLHPGRADVIDAGALILSRVLRRGGQQTLVVSESDILDGIAGSLHSPGRHTP